MCPMTGASAQECSALIPHLPSENTIKQKLLSNQKLRPSPCSRYFERSVKSVKEFSSRMTCNVKTPNWWWKLQPELYFTYCKDLSYYRCKWFVPMEQVHCQEKRWWGHRKTSTKGHNSNPRSAQHLISPHSTTAESFIKLTLSISIEEMIINVRSFDCQTNSPSEFQKKLTEKVWRIWILMLWCKGVYTTFSFLKSKKI